MGADAFEPHMSHIEGAFEQMDKRLGSVEARLGSVEARLGSIETQVQSFRTEAHGDIRELRAEMREQFRWLLGLLVLAILAPEIVRFLGR
jgi:hypothetical protein